MKKLYLVWKAGCFMIADVLGFAARMAWPVLFYILLALVMICSLGTAALLINYMEECKADMWKNDYPHEFVPEVIGTYCRKKYEEASEGIPTSDKDVLLRGSK